MDDGRCHHASCRGVWRVLCPYRGQHPVVCSHPPLALRSRDYLRHGVVPETVTECTLCGRAVHE